MLRHRILWVLDSTAHFLHLPWWALRPVCDAYERDIWAGFEE